MPYRLRFEKRQSLQRQKARHENRIEQDAACEKFIRRYGAVEQGARDRGVSVSDLTLEEMTGLWNAAK